MEKSGVIFEVVLEGVDPENVPAETLARMLLALGKLAQAPIALVGVEKR
jgi:hypothetical protein